MYRSTLSRIQAAERIIEAFRPHGFVVGGYLRDLIAGDEFNDVDLFVPSGGWHVAERKNTSVELLSKFNIVSKIHLSIYSTAERYIVDVDGVTLQVDLIYEDFVKFGGDDPFRTAYHRFDDVDINQLYRHPETNELRSFVSTVSKITRNIKERKFRVPFSIFDGPREYRIKKLLDKGYTRKRFWQ